MKIAYTILLYLFMVFPVSVQLWGQDHHDRWNSIDVKHYYFAIDLNDSTDVITGVAEIDILFKTELSFFQLDLAGVDSRGKGMTIDGIWEGGKAVAYDHAQNLVKCSVSGHTEGTMHHYCIRYHGIPADGLIISQNKFGDRTFFGDNWPDRARYWLPVVDHPSDKATVEFLVEAPCHYNVVSNGSNLNEIRENGRVTSHWKTAVPLPTKVMVIGISPFAVQNLESASGIPVSTWVYPQNEKEGFFDYAIATRPLDFFEWYIAPYPFSKLANVQSKTRFGGMENASCVFYNEQTVTGQRLHESLFAHEIAHQWFGDGVSEGDWHHIWLSEGFATYLTDIYIEHMQGREAFVASLLNEKERVLEYARKKLAPIVDTTLPVSVKLLNPNSYEKAAWALHMLRKELGDELFQQCVRSFYDRFKFENALTEDFREVVDSLSGSDHGLFFRQWFCTPGHPVLSSHWDFEDEEITLVIRQHQEGEAFQFPLEVGIEYEDGTGFVTSLPISLSEESFQLKASRRPVNVILDPDTWLLFENFRDH
jgi:aminopeptidase N